MGRGIPRVPGRVPNTDLGKSGETRTELALSVRFGVEDQEMLRRSLRNSLRRTQKSLTKRSAT
jgi:hypothetical protein